MAHTDAKGEVKYFSMIARDITERKRAERSIAESEARYRTLFENAPEAVIVVDDDTRRFVDANENALRLFGLSREALLGTGPLELSPSVQPGGASSASLFRRYLRRALRGKTPSFEWSHVDAAGRVIPCEMRFVRLPGQRRLVRGSITDITERKRAEERQRLLAHELDHRVKNNLAAVLALCDQTAASTRTLEEFQRDFAGRIRAMAGTHEALARGRWSGVALVDAVQLAVRPYDFGNASRIKTAGERTVLPSRLASPLGLALHELATNAAKYGSLSSADGRVEVEWTRGEDRGLRLSWTERNGPAVQDPSREGLGLRLVRGLVEHEIGGTVRFEFNPDGLVCDMLLPAA
jgi:PAS domain S-box-containing protein